MGLDWYVGICYKDTYEQVDSTAFEYGKFDYHGEVLVRGACVANIMRQYGFPDGYCYGNIELNEENKEVGPFLDEDSDVDIINSYFKDFKLRHINPEDFYGEMSVTDQQECLDEMDNLVADVKQYNKNNTEYQARIYCSY